MANHLDITHEQVKAFQAYPIDQAIQMLNLLKFKKQVDDTSQTGEERYKEYMKAAYPFFEKSNARILFYGNAVMTLIGPDGEKEWDKVLIVEYASKTDFFAMITTEGYPSGLRKSALLDSRLILCEATR